jgi:hypothetical protein
MNTSDRTKALTPRDEQYASQYTLVKDRSTIFGGGWSDDAAMRVIVDVLDYIGDDLGRMVKTTEVAWATMPGRQRSLGQSIALSALSVLDSWGFVANLGEVNGRYVYARTSKPARQLGHERHMSWLGCMQARERTAREKQAQAV